MTDNSNQPVVITTSEWQEIINLPLVRKSWGLLEDETLENFLSIVYGAKFNFHSGSPGYVGDLYILQGDILTGQPPFVFVRHDSKLVLINEIDT